MLNESSMEKSDSPASENITDESLTNRKPGHSRLLDLTVTLIVLMVSVFGVYYSEHAKVASIAHQNNSLDTQIATLNEEIKQQNNINNGIVAVGSLYKDPAGKIGLLSGAITMTLPQGWSRVPQQDDCSGGTIDSEATCTYVTAVAPTSLINVDGSSKWSVNVGVFDYSKSNGTAKDWFYTEYQGMAADSTIVGTTNIFTVPVNGYSTYAIDYPASASNIQAYYVIAHGSYVVVVSADIQDSLSAFDYLSTYQPSITQMVQSIKFQ